MIRVFFFVERSQKNFITSPKLTLPLLHFPRFSKLHLNNRRRVDCTPPSSLGVNVNNNVGPGGWVRLVVQKTGGPGGVKSVQVKGGDSGSWQPMQNKFGTAWEITSAPQLPWDFKFVSDDGQEVVATKAVDKSGRVGDLPLGVQFGPSKAASSGRKMLVDALEPAVRQLLEAEAPESNAGFGAAFHVVLA